MQMGDEADQVKVWRALSYEGFLQMSTTNSDFFAFINAPVKKTTSVVDYIFWRLMCRSQ
jgi:hypothetical protein